MMTFLVFVGLFLVFYIPAVALRNRRLRLLALEDPPEIPVSSSQVQAGASKLLAATLGGPPQYVCLVDGQSQSYKRGTPEYTLVQEAIRRM